MGVVLRWVRRLVVVALLAAPVVVVVLVARPDDSSEAAEVRDEGSGPDGALVDGDRVDGELSFNETAAFTAVGDGPHRIGATSDFADLTITVRGDGTESFNDDTNGLNPEVTVDLVDGEEYTVEVRELGGRPTPFSLYVEAG